MNYKFKLALFILLIGAFSTAVFSPKYNNSITGQEVISRVEISNVVPINCDFNMTSGWNYVSFHCLASSVPRDEALLRINSSYDKIFSYNAFDTTDPWKSYNPDLPSWAIQQLNYMGRPTGYIILINNNTNYNYSGYVRSTTIQLRPGWNFVGYPSSLNQSINDSLDGILYTMVLTYDDGNLLVYLPNSTNNNLTTFEPYKAYWINSSASQNWLVG
jgi:hypothetical protein